MKASELRKWSVAKLKKELLGLEQTINYCCYGVKDLILRCWLENELYRRGYEIQEGSPKIVKGRF